MMTTVSAVRHGLGLSLAALFVSALAMGPVPAGAQTVRQVFEKVSPSVVVIRARGRDVTASGQTRFSETGSGVLISADGKVMTAAHVVHAMDENTAKQLLLEKRSFWSGLEGIVLSDALADLLNLPPRASGYIVKTVAKGSPADEIGLRGSTQIVNISGQEVPLGGDIILSVDGIPLSAGNLGVIRDSMNKLAAGAPYKVSILRAGQVLELTGTLP